MTDQISGLESSDKDYMCAHYNHSRSFGERILTPIEFYKYKNHTVIINKKAKKNRDENAGSDFWLGILMGFHLRSV